VIGASSNSVISFKKYFNKNAVLINETGCRVAEYIYKENRIEKDTLDVLWVGKMDFRKQLALALRVVAESGIENIKLHIVGGGDDEPYRSISKKLNIVEKCKWHGILPHDDVQILMQQCDLLLFTSVAEGTPHVVLEAIANSLPVICFDTCGQGDCVNNAIGRKVPLTNPKQSVIDFAEHLKYFAEHRDELRKMSEACIERAKELSWENKISKLLSIYEKL
jgi:glycosyltransferase involved in cell wall biosynthesis